MDNLKLQLHAVVLPDDPTDPGNPGIVVTDYQYNFLKSYLRTSGYSDGSMLDIDVAYAHVSSQGAFTKLGTGLQHFSCLLGASVPTNNDWTSARHYGLITPSVNPAYSQFTPTEVATSDVVYAIARVEVRDLSASLPGVPLGTRNPNFHSELLTYLGFSDISTSSTLYDYVVAEVRGSDIATNLTTSKFRFDFNQLLVPKGDSYQVPVIPGIKYNSTAVNPWNGLENNKITLQTRLGQVTSSDNGYPDTYFQYDSSDMILGGSYEPNNDPNLPTGLVDISVQEGLMSYIKVPWNHSDSTSTKLVNVPLTVNVYGTAVGTVFTPAGAPEVSSTVICLSQATDYTEPNKETTNLLKTKAFEGTTVPTNYRIPIFELLPSFETTSSNPDNPYVRAVTVVDKVTSQGTLSTNQSTGFWKLGFNQLDDTGSIHPWNSTLFLSQGLLKSKFSGNNSVTNFLIITHSPTVLYLPVTLACNALDASGISVWENITGTYVVNWSGTIPNPETIINTELMSIKWGIPFMVQAKFKPTIFTDVLGHIPESATVTFTIQDEAGNQFKADIKGYNASTPGNPFWLLMPFNTQTLSVQVTAEGVTLDMPIDMGRLTASAGGGEGMYEFDNPAPPKTTTYSALLVDQATRQTKRIQTYIGLDSKALIEAVGFTPVPIAIKPLSLTEELFAVGQSNLSAVSHLGTPFICKYNGVKYRILKQLEDTKPAYRILLTQGTGYSLKATYSGVEYASNFTGYQDTSFVVNATATEGYNITRIAVNGTTVANGASVAITGEMTVTVTVALIECLVVVTQTTGGTITINGEVITEKKYPYWTELTVNAIPDSGYELEQVVITEQAVFYTVYITQPANGTLKVGIRSAAFKALSGSTYVIQATANPGYRVNSVSVNGTVVTNGSTLTVNGNKTVTAEIVPDTAQIIIQQPSNAVITVDGNKTATFSAVIGTTHTVAIAANTGYNVTSLKVNGVSVASGSSFTLNGETTITATVEIIKLTLQVTQPANGSIKVNNVVVSGNQEYNYGTSLTIQATANSGYEVDWLDVSDL